MQNLQNDNHLDKLSREAAEQFEPDQQLHSWEKLHPRLEAALPQKNERNRRFLVLLLLVLLIGGGITFSALWNNRNEDAKKQLTSKTQDADKTEQPKPAATNPVKDDGRNASSQPVLNNNDKPQSAIPVKPGDETGKSNDNSDEPVVTASSIDRDKIDRNKNTQKIADRGITPNDRINNRINNTQKSPKKGNEPGNDLENKALPEKKNSTIQPTEIKERPDPKDKINKDELQQITDKATSESQTEKTQADKTVDAQVNKTAPANETIKPGTEETKSLAKTGSPEKKKNQVSSLKKRWEFGFTYAPDISTVKFTHTQKPGTNLGLTIAYNFSGRFALQTGLIHTTKNYKMRGEDYHPPKHYWTTYVDLKTVTGECTMWDIPLNLRYNLAPKKSSNLFATAGLSSYLMNKEDYDFYYYYNGNPVSRYRSYDTSNSHLFSVLNLSIAYERQLSRTISLQAEPFFKQPLSGVGLGNIKLNSTGIYFSLKYRPFAGQKSK